MSKRPSDNGDSCSKRSKKVSVFHISTILSRTFFSSLRNSPTFTHTSSKHQEEAPEVKALPCREPKFCAQETLIKLGNQDKVVEKIDDDNMVVLLGEGIVTAGNSDQTVSFLEYVKMPNMQSLFGGWNVGVDIQTIRYAKKAKGKLQTFSDISDTVAYLQLAIKKQTPFSSCNLIGCESSFELTRCPSNGQMVPKQRVEGNGNKATVICSFGQTRYLRVSFSISFPNLPTKCETTIKLMRCPGSGAMEACSRDNSHAATVICSFGQTRYLRVSTAILSFQ